MNKKIILTILAISGILICYFSFTYFNRNIYTIWNMNKLNVSTLDNINLDKVKIYYGTSVNSINRENDMSLFSDMSKYTILFKDGKEHTELPNEYGENDFLITYDNKYYFSFRHFKFNRNHQHSYKFKIEETSNPPQLYVKIKGEDAIEFNRTMLSISDASKHVCNTPIDTIKVIYNMVDLQ